MSHAQRIPLGVIVASAAVLLVIVIVIVVTILCYFLSPSLV